MIDGITRVERMQSINRREIKRVYPDMKPKKGWLAVAGAISMLGLLGLVNDVMRDRYGDDNAILYQAVKAKADIASNSKRNGT